MVDVNGQKIPCSPPGWGESLFSAVHVGLTQMRAVKNITRRVAENTNGTGVRLVLAAIRGDFALRARAKQFDGREIIIDGKQPLSRRAIANCQ